jgi:hypothetical protein
MTTSPGRSDTTFPGEFVELTECLVNGDGPIELLSRVMSVCVDLLAVQTAGVMLADHWGALGTIASSSEQMRCRPNRACRAPRPRRTTTWPWTA